MEIYSLCLGKKSEGEKITKKKTKKAITIEVVSCGKKKKTISKLC
jgi:hypothetical protein